MSIPTLTANREIVKKPTGDAVVSASSMSTLRDGYMLVNTAAIALNRADWTDIDSKREYRGASSGLDDVGTVVAVPAGCSTRTSNRGDRVCGPMHGCHSANPEDGAFTEYAVVKADLPMRIPGHMSFEDAATLGCEILTVGQGLYQNRGLPLPTLDGHVEKTGRWVPVYGGSSATRTFTIHFAKLSGHQGVTTCSPRNFELLRAIGADVVLDHAS